MEESTKRKVVAVFDPTESCQTVLREFLEAMGYRVEVHASTATLEAALRGPARVDLLILNLALLGASYQEVLAALERWKLTAAEVAPVVAVTRLPLSREAGDHLERLGAREVVSPRTPLMELLFAVNRLLFPKISELRKYTRVFGGFPVQFESDGTWHQGEVYNISQEGAFIQCEAPPAERARLRVRFVLPGSQAPLVVQAFVNWINEPGSERDLFLPPGMGVSFTTLNQEETASLDRFISGKVNGADRPDGSSASPA